MASSATFAALGEVTIGPSARAGCGCWVAAMASRSSRRPVWMRCVAGGATSRNISRDARYAPCAGEHRTNPHKCPVRVGRALTKCIDCRGPHLPRRTWGTGRHSYKGIRETQCTQHEDRVLGTYGSRVLARLMSAYCVAVARTGHSQQHWRVHTKLTKNLWGRGQSRGLLFHVAAHELNPGLVIRYNDNYNKMVGCVILGQAATADEGYKISTWH